MELEREVKLKLLNTLQDEKVYSLYKLAQKCGTNSKTVKKNLGFLEKIGLVTIDKTSENESASGRASYRIQITEYGLKAVKRTKNR